MHECVKVKADANICIICTFIYAARVFQLPEVLEKNIFWINMLAYMHAMINPVIYITLNEKFRQEFTKAVFLGKAASTESKSMLYFKKRQF